MSDTDHLLLIDAGNTRIKWAVWTRSTSAWSQRGAAETRAFVAAPNGATGLSSVFASVGRVVVSNVAGADVETRLRGIAGVVPLHTILATASCGGVENRYDDVAQLGTDRFAALIGANGIVELAGKAKLVVVTGTAVTVDALTAGGVFLGGAILPGPDMMRRVLNRETAQLPLSGAGGPSDAFPGNTNNAIAAGISEALAGAVMIGAQRLARQTTPPAEVGLVVSGGAATGLVAALACYAPSLAAAITMREHLVLEGLRLIACSSPSND